MGPKKKGKKGKKGGEAAAMLKKFAESPREFMIKENMTEIIVHEIIGLRLEELEEENKTRVTEYHRMLKDFKKSQQEDEEAIRDYDKQNDDLILEKQKLEEQNRNLEKEIADQRAENDGEIKAKREENAKKLEALDNDVSGIESEIDQKKDVKKKQIQLEEDLRYLAQTIVQEKKDRMIEINEAEREKIQATEKLRKEMLYKIKETKANLLALNDEQLQTTTRLTILQNH